MQVEALGRSQVDLGAGRPCRPSSDSDARVLWWLPREEGIYPVLVPIEEDRQHESRHDREQDQSGKGALR